MKNKFEHWLKRSAPRQQFIYHVGPTLEDCDPEALRIVRTAVDYGYITLTRERIGKRADNVVSDFAYIATRLEEVVPYDYFLKVDSDVE